MPALSPFFAAVLTVLSLAWPAQSALLDTSASFQVARVFYQSQRTVDAAATSDGFVVVWNEYDSLEGPAQVYGAHVSLLGETAAGPFAINTPTSGYGVRPSSVQSFPDGGFIVAWVDVGTQDSVHARRFNSDTSPLGTEFVVAGPMTTSIYSATVAAAGDGTFLVVWQSATVGGRALQALRYNATGDVVPGIIAPSEGDSTNLRSEISASGGSDGRFVVVWTAGFTYETGAAGGYYPYTRFEGRGRAIAADGSMPASVFDAGGQYGLHVRHLGDDEFVVAWSDSYRSYDVVPAPLDVQAAIHHSDASTTELQVSRRIDYDEDGPNTGLAAAGDEGFVVAWSHYYPYSSGASDPADAFVRQVGTDGQVRGDAVPLAVDMAGQEPVDPAVAVSGDRALVVWHDGDAIRGQILEIVDDVVCGDVNRNGSLSATDALGALIAAVGGRYCSRLLCDADGDGAIDATDALLILRAAIDETMVLSCV